MTTTKNTTIPTTSLSIAQSIAKIETKAEFKSFMVATFNYDKKLSPSQIVREYSAKTGLEVEDTDDFKAVLSNIAKDSDINTLPKTPETLPNVEQKDIDTTNDEKAILAEKRAVCLGQIKIAETTQELCEVARKFSPLYAENRQTLDKAKGILDLFKELFALGFTEKDCQKLQIIGTKGNKETLSKQSVYDTFQIASGQRVRTKSEGTGEKKAKVENTSAFSVEQIKQGIRVKFDLIDTLLRDISLDKKILDIREGVEAEMSKAKVKETLSNNVQSMKNAGLNVEDMLAQIEAMKAMINAMNA